MSPLLFSTNRPAPARGPVLTLTALLSLAILLCLTGCRSSSTAAPQTQGTGNREQGTEPITQLPNHPITQLPNTQSPNALVSAQFKPSPALYVEGPATPPRVALTFDAGSDAKAVPLILKTLAEHHVHATFFLTGKFCETFPQECRAIAEAGMELGNHSYSHPHFTQLSDDEIRDQLERAEAAIVKACGRGAKPLFRFPYGDYDKRTRHLLAEEGYQAIHWTLDSLDSFGKPKSADYVAERILRKVKPGYITLMHVSCVGSAEALPRIFDYLDKVGAQVVPISDLILSQPSATAPPTSASRP